MAASMASMFTIFSYVLAKDFGMAPCVQDGRLSLALCKVQGRKRDRVELELVVELIRTRELLCGFGASSSPSSRSFEFEFDEAAGLRDRVFTEFLCKRLMSWFEFEKRHFPSTGKGPKGSPF